MKNVDDATSWVERNLESEPGEEGGPGMQCRNCYPGPRVCVVCMWLPISGKLEFRSLGEMARTKIVNKS